MLLMMCWDIKSSAALRDILYVVLVAGNFLNKASDWIVLIDSQL